MRNKFLDSFAINFIKNHFDEIDLEKSFGKRKYCRKRKKILLVSFS